MRSLAASALLLMLLLPCGADPAATWDLAERSRVARADGVYDVRTQVERWDPRQSAVIVCDMWDTHWCRSAAARTAELAPRINDFITAARQKGALVIHAPSDVVGYYEGTPARQLARAAPRAANLPPDIDRWCDKISAQEKEHYPIDQSDGGCDCQPRCKGGPPWPWKHQIDTITIDPQRDAISASGSEIWNLLEQRGISHVMLVGVHTNMCVLGRPFGLRQLAKNGKHVVLVRDLTDTMYNPRAAPYVDHFRGTEIIIEHIEKFVCPTISSDQVLGGAPFRFAADTAATQTGDRQAGP